MLVNSYFTVKSKYKWFKLRATDVFGKIGIYEAQAVLFHAPSEHQINNKQFDLEMQFILKRIDKIDKYAKLSIFAEVEANRRS